MKPYVIKFLIISLLAPNFCVSNVTVTQNSQYNIYYQEIQEAKEKDPYIKKRKMDIDIPIVKSCLNWIDVIKEFEKRGKDTSFIDRLKDYGFLNFMELLPENMILLKEGNAPKLFGSIKKYAEKLSIPIPLVFLSEDENFYNAAASSLSHNYSLIMIGEKLLKDSSKEDFDAIIAHELGHIKKNHVPKLLLLSVPVTVTLNYLLIFYWLKLIVKDFKNNNFFQTITFKTTSIILISVIFTIVLNKILRGFEKQADLTAFNALDNPDSMVKLMERFEEKIDKKLDNEFNYLFDRIESEMNDGWLKDRLESSAESNYQVGKFFETIFKPISSHPSSKTRKEYLKKEAEKLKITSPFIVS